MKTIYLIFGLGIILTFACNKEDDQFKVISEDDIIALKGMDEAFQAASLYNDSLSMCVNDPIGCDSMTMFYYDEQFHQNDDLFEMHHENYSHNNVGDDHYHDGTNNIQNGGMMHNENDGHNNEDHQFEHNQETLGLMMDLREMHDIIHP